MRRSRLSRRNFVQCRRAIRYKRVTAIEGTMTPEEFKQKMQEAFPTGGHDEEYAHGYADALMCELLTSLGYGEGVKIFQSADKWYA